MVSIMTSTPSEHPHDNNAPPQEYQSLGKRPTISSPALYPIIGIYYFISHPFLYPLMGARIIPLTILSVIIMGALFAFTYLPQVAFLAIFHGFALAWVNAAFAVLGESALIVGLLFEAFMVDETMVNIFDAVLIDRGMVKLVSNSRIVIPQGENPVKQLGKLPWTAVYAPFSLRQIVEFILLLPLNLVPLFGTPLFLILTGYRGGPFHHWRYFKLLKYSRKERNAAIRSRQLSYTCFGSVALLLQLVPVLQMFLLMTTAAGAALWAAELERARLLEEEFRNDASALLAHAEEPRSYTNNEV